ncbi:hypothetical protein LSAT2_008101 [Lamellibrachia satsuma]|nr:hypothetical protein LSAT2_008101 [Lamellibrachia satsuma]
MSMLSEYGQPELWGHFTQHFVEEGLLNLNSVLSRKNLPDIAYLLRSGAASDITKLYFDHIYVFAEEDAGRSLGSALASMSQLGELRMTQCNIRAPSFCHITDGICRGCPQMTKFEELGLCPGGFDLEMPSISASRPVKIYESFLLDHERNAPNNVLWWAERAEDVKREEHRRLLSEGSSCWSCPARSCGRLCRWNQMTDDSEEALETVLRQRPGLKILVRACRLSNECQHRLRRQFRQRFDSLN